jgi:hypothetical protein
MTEAARSLPSSLQEPQECAAMSRSNLPVPVGPVVEVRRERVTPYGRAERKGGAFEAHLLGQDGMLRGLKGGETVLDAARHAYLDTEYSGEADRRPPAGVLKVRDI